MVSKISHALCMHAQHNSWDNEYDGFYSSEQVMLSGSWRTWPNHIGPLKAKTSLQLVAEEEVRRHLPAALEESRHRVVNGLEKTQGKETQVASGTDSSPWLTALNPRKMVFLAYGLKDMNSANNQWSWKRTQIKAPAPAGTLIGAQWDPEQRIKPCPAEPVTYRNRQIINSCCLKMLILWWFVMRQ